MLIRDIELEHLDLYKAKVYIGEKICKKTPFKPYNPLSHNSINPKTKEK
ncbi:hypothetical protein PCC9214_05851 [Planktothrix tepida]|uniref:Uncharacterized protein n=1 Tax=Planktothrix tepida PCC 9214 TaxID=671072 RepID=A0A1J1LUD1_9CYAN|nr:hypothetical protein [Planktothrix tepida]CAD5990802.1 hypothetical protein PCC9214_05851 [Planktothrix tepida]CUR36197.1 hypothetical protein PL9214880003 [Planktothrix tepida PCC 9214]